MKKQIVMMLAAVSLLLFMCSSSPSVRLSTADNQKEISVKKGDIIELALDTQPSTGYSWQIASLSCIEKCGYSRIDSGGDSRAMGRVETVYMQFKAVKAGSGFIELKYIRLWQPDENPARIYKVSLAVEEK